MDPTFRPLTDDDLPLLHRWLNEPGVVRWWEGDDVSWEAVVRDYGSARPDPTEHWLALAGDEPVGWIQCYLAADYAGEDEPDAWFRLGLPRTTGGIDYLVGEPASRGRGLGSRMIRAFVDDVVLPGHPTWTHVAASPLAANVASWRALEKAGFETVGEFDDELGPCRLLVTERVRRAVGSPRGLRSLTRPDEEPEMSQDEGQREEEQGAEDEGQEPEQTNPGGQARPDRDDVEYHDGV